jgi:hypothetical protein
MPNAMEPLNLIFLINVKVMILTFILYILSIA